MEVDRYEKQSFLGETSQEIISRARIALVGLGGGGSHIAQQLTYIGFKKYLLLDHDRVEEKNLNRLVTATTKDATKGALKIAIFKRLIRSLHKDAEIEAFPCKWEEKTDLLRCVDVVMSCVDTYATRRDLEAFCRRLLIPMIDIGIDVHKAPNGQPHLAGQVILSMPGAPCLHCMGFLTEKNLAEEAAQYGAAGGRPQVVWPNGIVASTAVGGLVDLLTDWTKSLRSSIYQCYDGNRGILFENTRAPYFPKTCTHYPLSAVGAAVFKKL